MALNKFIGMGRLTRDPEHKALPNDSSVVNFCIAIERNYKDKQTGERGADFINCVAWNKTADYVAKYFSKGKMAVVEGRIQTRSWDGEDGKKKYSTEVVADNIYFGESKKQEQTTSESSGGEQQFTELSDSDGDLPF